MHSLEIPQVLADGELQIRHQNLSIALIGHQTTNGHEKTKKNIFAIALGNRTHLRADRGHRGFRSRYFGYHPYHLPHHPWGHFPRGLPL